MFLEQLSQTVGGRLMIIPHRFEQFSQFLHVKETNAKISVYAEDLSGGYTLEEKAQMFPVLPTMKGFSQTHGVIKIDNQLTHPSFYIQAIGTSKSFINRLDISDNLAFRMNKIGEIDCRGGQSAITYLPNDDIFCAALSAGKITIAGTKNKVFYSKTVAPSLNIEYDEIRSAKDNFFLIPFQNAVLIVAITSRPFDDEPTFYLCLYDFKKDEIVYEGKHRCMSLLIVNNTAYICPIQANNSSGCLEEIFTSELLDKNCLVHMSEYKWQSIREYTWQYIHPGLVVVDYDNHYLNLLYFYEREMHQHQISFAQEILHVSVINDLSGQEQWLVVKEDRGILVFKHDKDQKMLMSVDSLFYQPENEGKETLVEHTYTFLPVTIGVSGIKVSQDRKGTKIHLLTLSSELQIETHIIQGCIQANTHLLYRNNERFTVVEVNRTSRDCEALLVKNGDIIDRKVIKPFVSLLMTNRGLHSIVADFFRTKRHIHIQQNIRVGTTKYGELSFQTFDDETEDIFEMSALQSASQRFKYKGG